MFEPDNLPPAQVERRDVTLRLVWIGAPALLATIIALCLLVLWLFPSRSLDRTLELPLPSYPDPQLQTRPHDDLARLRAQQLQQLDSAGWIDAEHHIAHIPIDDAMRQVARDGIEGWPR